MKSFTVANLLGLAAAAPQVLVAVVDPGLWALATRDFTIGPAYNSTEAQNVGPVGLYNVSIDDRSPRFWDRTIYYPTGVANGTSVPAVIWANGNCFKYGAMYSEFLREIASHGYMVVAPGAPAAILKPGRTDQQFISESIDLVQNSEWAPFAINKAKIAIAGHGCGGYEATEIMAYDDAARITTGLFFNAAGQNSSIDNFSVPSLWVSGGALDRANSAASFENLVINDKFIPTYRATLQTGSRGTFWQPRGGAYAEAAVRWLDLWLKQDQSALASFPSGQVQSATARGWVVESNAFPAEQRITTPPQAN